MSSTLLLHHRDPHVLHGVARADLDGQRRLRAGADIEKRNHGGGSGSGHYGAACQSGHLVSSWKWAALRGPAVRLQCSVSLECAQDAIWCEGLREHFRLEGAQGIIDRVHHRRRRTSRAGFARTLGTKQ